MIDSIRGYRQTQSILSDIKNPPVKTTTVQSPSSQKDTVFISEEARRLLEESKMQKASANTGNTLGAGAEKSVSQIFRDYIKNPTLAHALDKMKDAVEGLGLSEAAMKEVYERVEQTFRSGIPEKGKQTSDTLGNLEKELKKTGILSDDQLVDLMADISNIVSWAQEEGDADESLADNASKK